MMTERENNKKKCFSSLFDSNMSFGSISVTLILHMNLTFDVSCFLVFNFYVFIIVGQGDLHRMIRKSMYAGVMNNLFGKNVLPVNNQV